MVTVCGRLDEDGKVLTPEEILYRVCILSYFVSPCIFAAAGFTALIVLFRLFLVVIFY